MKQLLIVNSNKALNATNATPYDLSGLEKGAITFWELGSSSALSSAPTKNFGIALGRGNNSPAFVIPEVDISTLEITKSLPTPGAAFSTTFTFPTPTAGKEYGLTILKLGTVLNERNTFHVSIVAKSSTAATEAAALRTAINNKSNELLEVTASGSSTTITITGNKVGQGWKVILTDELASVSQSSTVTAVKAIGDKEYVVDLASRCAAGKGFNYLGEDGKEIYPGYPEDVENLIPNTSGQDGVSTAGYVVFNLHFATKRESGKQLNSPVWQYVHIAVPITNSSYNTISGILPEGKFTEANVAALAARVEALEDADDGATT